MGFAFCQAEINRKEDKWDETARWVDESKKIRNLLGVLPKALCQPYSTDPTRKHKGMPRKRRLLEILDVATTHSQKIQRVGDLYCDISQGIQRKQWGDKVTTLLTGSSIFDFSRDQMVLPGELIALQGADARTFRFCDLPGSQITDVVGESFFVPSIAQVLISVFLNQHAPWWAAKASS